MDHLALTQCGFCSHLNVFAAPACEFCGDTLSPSYLFPPVSVSALFEAPPPPAYCAACNRRLLLNGRTCTFCTAFYGTVPPPRRTRLYNPLLPQPLDSLTDTLVSMVVGVGLRSPSETEVQPLSASARARVLRSVDETEALVEQTCAVCLESLDRAATSQLVCCHNKFHTECLDGWFRTRSTCPLCRHNLNSVLLPG